jgi:hypothetical protein
MGGIADNSRRHALGATRFDCNESTTQASTNSVLFGSTPPNAYAFEPVSWCRSKSFDLLVALLRIAAQTICSTSRVVADGLGPGKRARAAAMVVPVRGYDKGCSADNVEFVGIAA